MRAVLLGCGQRQHRDPSLDGIAVDIGPIDIGPVAGRDAQHRLRCFFRHLCKVVRVILSPIMFQRERRSPIMKAAYLLQALTNGLFAALLAVSSAAAQDNKQQTQQAGLDKVSFGTNWVAEAEHGGFFQAVADGTYRKYGLDVTIVPGGPNDNNRMLLLARKIDFYMTANTLMSFDAVTNNVPVVSVAAMFQKDP